MIELMAIPLLFLLGAAAAVAVCWPVDRWLEITRARRRRWVRRVELGKLGYIHIDRLWRMANEVSAEAEAKVAAAMVDQGADPVLTVTFTERATMEDFAKVREVFGHRARLENADALTGGQVTG